MSKPTSVPQPSPLELEAWEEVYALEHMSYTGGQPDLDQHDVETISHLIARLAAELLLVRGTTAIEKSCRVCGGLGAIDGFWLGSTKTCPSCHGRGRQ